MRISSQLEALREAVESMRDASSASLEMSQSVLIGRHDDSANLTREEPATPEVERESEKKEGRSSRRRLRRPEGTVELLERENELLRTLCGELQSTVAAATGRRSSVSVDVKRSDSSPRSFGALSNHEPSSTRYPGVVELIVEGESNQKQHHQEQGTQGQQQQSQQQQQPSQQQHADHQMMQMRAGSPFPATSSTSSSSSSLIHESGESRTGMTITRHGPHAFPKGISMQSFASTDTDWLMDNMSRGNTVFQFHSSSRDAPQQPTTVGGTGRLSSGGSARGLLPGHPQGNSSTNLNNNAQVFVNNTGLECHFF